jgi:hypothetical protein
MCAYKKVGFRIFSYIFVDSRLEKSVFSSASRNLPIRFNRVDFDLDKTHCITNLPVMTAPNTSSGKNG